MATDTHRDRPTERVEALGKLVVPEGVSPAIASIRGGPMEHVGVNYSLFDVGNFQESPLTQRQKKTNIFIICISAQSVRGAKQRSRVRATWAKQIREEFEDTVIDVRFFVGTGRRKQDKDSKPVSDDVMAEKKAYNDLVIIDAPDDYSGLINKVRTSFQWVLNDRGVNFVAKLDDDCYVNVANLIVELQKYKHQKRLYFGKIMNGGKILRHSRNAEPNLPKSMDWYPPYASGAGYVLSTDLAHAVAFPAVKLVDMINEDAHLGIVLLPFDVKRVNSPKLHIYGLNQCIPPEDALVIHYVKDKSDHDCFQDLHTNITSGQPVCKSRYCGPITCDEPPPKGKLACPGEVKDAKWELIRDGYACEINPEKIERFTIGKHMVDVSCCKKRCEETCGCMAMDYYSSTMWCNLYKEPCKTPLKKSTGTSSWRMVKGRVKQN